MTKEKILDKALELFVTKGYFGCSMDDIAKAVEIKKPRFISIIPARRAYFRLFFKES